MSLDVHNPPWYNRIKSKAYSLRAMRFYYARREYPIRSVINVSAVDVIAHILRGLGEVCL